MSETGYVPTMERFMAAKEIIRLKPVFKQMVWGGNRMRESFGYDIPGDDTGECWAVSAHSHGDCRIQGGEFDGMTLSQLWREKPELFGRSKTEMNAGTVSDQSDEAGQVFPLLTKIIDAKQDLSVQVHPDDSYASKYENGSKGKTECWYILDCDPGSTIIIGHNAKTHEELKEMVENGRWNELLREIPIQKGDFFQIFPGTIHAIKGGTMILETQQNSDITYRLYDYGRLQNGHPRELHLKKSLDVVMVPFDPEAGFSHGTPLAGGRNEALVECDLYRVWHLICENSETYKTDGVSFMLCSVIGGEGLFDDVKVVKGDHFIVPAGYGGFSLKGDLELICSAAQ